MKLREQKINHFCCNCSETDADILDGFLQALENAYDNILRTFHFSDRELHGAYSFFLCPDVETYIHATGKRREDYQPWMVGNSNAAAKRITILSPKAAEDCTLEYLKSVAVHELVHLILDDATGSPENEEWIAEGIAILISEQTDLRYVSEEDYPLISQISGESFADNGGYDYAGIYVWYFIKKFGFEEFLKAYKNQINLRDTIFHGFEQDAIREYRAVNLGNR